MENSMPWKNTAIVCRATQQSPYVFIFEYLT